MKTVYVALAVLLIGLFLAIANIAHAQWPALSSGYAVTTNWHGKEVPLGESVTVWAGTTDSNVQEVLFRWKRPDETIFVEINVPVVGPYTTPNVPEGVPQEIINWANSNPGINVYYANNTQTPDTLGDWGVQAFFRGPGGKTKAGVEETIAIRATSFNVIPDLPVVGTAGAVTAMLLGLGLFFQKKKQ
ncbi:MAG: hypothetical protein QXQ61_04020 [Candidatus Bathyarchaeia archaeon]